MSSAVAFGFDTASSWFCVATDTYKAAGDAQQRVEPCIVNLLLVLVCDIATLCLFRTPAAMGKIIRERERFGCRSPGVPSKLQTPQLAAALQDVIAGAASPAHHHVKEILVSHSVRWYGFSAFRFAFILVGRKLKVGSAEQLPFVAV